MAQKDFFEEEKQEEGQESPQEKIKLGEKEYSEDELSQLVGLGEIARDLEDKWKTKIDRVYPEYTKLSQARSQWEREKQEYEEKLKQQPTQQQQGVRQLTPEERQQALRQLDDLLKESSVVRQLAQQSTQETLAAKDLIDDVKYIISEAESNGQPSATVDELLGYMQENGVRNPSAAYRLMFENELRDIEIKKLQSLKQPGMVTTSQSTAGAKQPAPTKVTRDNLKSLVQEMLGGE